MPETERTFWRVGASFPSVCYNLVMHKENGAGQGLLRAGTGESEGQAYDLGFGTTWELDLFGRIQRTAEAADARLAAADETRREVMLGVVAEVVSANTELRGAERRLALDLRFVQAGRREIDLGRANERSTASRYITRDV